MEGSMFSPKGTENALEFLDSSCVGESLREYINIRYPYSERDNGCLNLRIQTVAPYPCTASCPGHLRFCIEDTEKNIDAQ